MHTFSLFIIGVVLPFITYTYASNWDSCSSTSPFHLTDATITPYPPVRGKNFKFTYTGSLDKTLSSGTQSFEVWEKIFGHWIQGPFSTKFDVCKENKCPIGPGSTTLLLTENLPSFVPEGTYKVRVNLTAGSDTNYPKGSQIACAEVEFSV